MSETEIIAAEAAKEAEDRPEATGAKPAEAKADAAAELPDPAKMVAEAEAAIAELQGPLEEARAKMAEAKAGFDALIAVRDKHIEVKEKYAEKLSHADAVKRVQAQTVAQLEKTKEQTRIAATALASAGISIFPSKLDESMARRKKTPEQAARQAQYINQRHADTVSGRTGV